MLDLLSKQVASPVQFVKGLHTLYEAGARVFVEVGPKKALQGFAEDVLGERGDVLSLFTNHPKFGDIASFNQALCGLYASGFGRGVSEVATESPARSVSVISAPTQRPAPIATPSQQKIRLHRSRDRMAITLPNSASSSLMFLRKAGRYIRGTIDDPLVFRL